MRWVLIRPLNQSLFYDPEIQEPLGLEYLASVLTAMGGKVLMLDSALDSLDDRKLARRAMSFQPDAIGFSITTDRELESVREIYSECKKNLAAKEIFWIAGGNYPTTEFSNAQKELPVEFHIMKYEGEISIRKIYQYLENGSKNRIPRLISGTAVLALDDLPFPSRNYSHYLKNYGWAFNLQGSRGCCSACKYCASKGMRTKAHHPQWRGRSPQNMVEEMVFLYGRYGARAFNFVDEDFLGPPQKALERATDFSSEIIRNNLKITMGIQVRPNSLSTEIIDRLSAAGLTYVFMGIESDNPNDFKNWGRAYCDKTWEWVAYLQEKNIEVNAGTLLFHPDCTLEGIKHFASKLQQYRLLNCRTAINRLDAMPGSFFYNEYVAQHPKHNSQGIIRLPFKNSEIEVFYKTLKKAIAPIEAPSMHALCSMPVCQTNRIFGKAEESYLILKEINADCDQRVADCFFSILEMFENKHILDFEIEKMITDNVQFGQSIIERLTANGFVRSPETLYAASNPY